MISPFNKWRQGVETRVLASSAKRALKNVYEEAVQRSRESARMRAEDVNVLSISSSSCGSGATLCLLSDIVGEQQAPAAKTSNYELNLNAMASAEGKTKERQKNKRACRSSIWVSLKPKAYLSTSIPEQAIFCSTPFFLLFRPAIRPPFLLSFPPPFPPPS